MDDLFPKHNQASEREIHFALFKGTTLLTGRLALHGWTRYHDTCYWWMISFQNTVKRESERERERASFTLFVLRDSLFINEWNMMTSAIDGWSLSKTQKRVIFTVHFWGMKVCTSRRTFSWMNETVDGWSLCSRNETPYIVVTHERKIGYCRGKKL
jgi:hypothetical protein